jgi:HAD superfamily hydrolase (TIGR01509 family)
VTTALLFDLDGTLVDSDREHLAAFQKVFTPHGVALDRETYALKIMGASNDAIGAAFLAHLTAAEREAALEAKEQFYRDGLGDIEPIAGVEELLDYADERQLPRAVVTNAPRANADVVLASLGLDHRLKIRVIGHELARPKPDPLPYLTGLELTGGRAEHSVAFEDSLSGARAAVAAGLAVVGVMTTLPAEALLGVGAVIAVADFRDPRIYELIEIRRRRAAHSGD